MDPKACLARLIRALRDNDLDEAAAAAADLGEWFHKGGFRIVIPGLARNLDNERLASLFDNTSILLRALDTMLSLNDGRVPELQTLEATH